MAETSSDNNISIENPLFGRLEITTPVEEITRDNIVDVLSKALAVHEVNSFQIGYLYNYMRGDQPILSRVKKIRPEICNKIVENHASEITQFTSGYFLGEPVTYVRRGDRENTSAEINLLNDYMFYEDKASHDKDMATWMAVCGVGYRMVLPDKNAGMTEDESPFEIDTPDPRYTFVVYHAGFGHRRMMGVRQIYRENKDKVLEMVCCGYTKTHYFEVKDGVVKVWKPHPLCDIPIFEYRLNMSRMGSFEPAVPLLNAINTIMSNRVDGVEQFIQSFLKFKNCEVEDDTTKRLQEMGAIVIKTSQGGLDSDVTIVSQELNQQQTQTLVDYLYDQVLVVCGMPTTTKGGSSTSDTITTGTKSISIKKDGGFVDAGQMFIAREAGPELVGNIGGRTAVANNDQIVEAVAAGVYGAVSQAMYEANGNGGNSRIVVNLDGKTIYENQQGIARGRGYDLGMGAFSFG